MFLALILSILATSFGGLWFTYRNPHFHSNKDFSFLISITTGFLTSVLFFSFLPHSVEVKSFHFFMFLGFFLILLANIFLIPSLTIFNFKESKEDHTFHHHHHHHLLDCPSHKNQKKIPLISSNTSCSIVGCLIVCCFFDGFELKVAFSINSQTGWVTGTALFFHVLPDGILTSSLMLTSGFNKKTRYLTSFLPGVFLALGFLTAFLLEFLPNWALKLIPFATGMLFYLLFTHLIPIALKNKRSFLWFALGSLLSLLLLSNVFSFFEGIDNIF